MQANSKKKKARWPFWAIAAFVLVLAVSAGFFVRWMQNRGQVEAPRQSEVPPPPKSVADARSLFSESKLAEADQAVRDALANPSTPKEEQYLLYIEQGRIAYDKGDKEAAAAAFTKAWEIRQTFDVATRLGSTWEELGDKTKAVEYYKKALELNPKDSPSYESDNNVLNQLIDILEAES